MSLPPSNIGGTPPGTGANVPRLNRAPLQPSQPMQFPVHPPRYGAQPTPPGSQGSHPSMTAGQMPVEYSNQPPPEKGEWTQGTIHARIMILGIVTCCCAGVLPVLGAIVMLWDDNYTFWEGRAFPMKVIVLSAFVVCALSVVCFVLHRKAPVDHINEHTMAVVVAVFSAFMGVSLILLALPASRTLYDTAGRVASGCRNSLPESNMLVDYSQVLYNLRQTPACAAMESVDLCDGWAENRYTSYLRYLEQEFHCGPLCAGDGAPVPSGSPSFMLVQANASKAQPLQRFRRSPATRTSLGVDTIAVSSDANNGYADSHHSLVEVAKQMPPVAGATQKLFSLGTTRMECYPLVATRLRVLAWHNNDLTFWEGFGLLCVSFLTSVVAFISICLSGGAVRRTKPRRLFS